MIFIMTVTCIKAQTTQVVIISTNDVHGRISNFGKMAAYVKSLKLEQPNVFVFNAGDLINGNPVVDEAEDKGAPIIELMNKVPYDVSCMGNHEFENGEATLQNRILQSTSMFVGANVIAAKGSAFHYTRPYTFLQLQDGTKIGVFGLTASSSNPCLIPNITITDPVKTALQFKTLRDSCQVMIALTHIGYRTDSLLATKMNSFDVIIGGHSHTELPKGKMVNGTLITQAGDKLRYVGKTTLIIKDHHIVGKSFVMIDLNKLTVTDREVQLLVDQYNAEPRFKQVVGRTPNGFANKEELGSLKADAIAKELDVDIAFDHARNVAYEHFPKGNISVGDIYEIDSYDYKLIRYELTPAEIRTLITKSVKMSSVPVLFVSGITYTLEKNTQGEVQNVTLENKNGPLNENKRYSVGMNSFISCHFMQNHLPGKTTSATAEISLINYLKKHPEVNYSGVKRIKEKYL